MTVAAISILTILALAVTFDILRNQRIRFRTLRIPSQYSAASDGKTRFRILHISDIHLTSSTLHKLEPFEKLAETEWDFVMITGDLIEDESGIEPVCEALGRLRARYGKYAVLGNHDYICFCAKNIYQWFRVLTYTFFGLPPSFCPKNDIERLAACLEQNRITLLRNELKEGVTENGERFQVIGIDDPSTGRDEPACLYSSVKEDAFRLVIMHSPRRLRAIRPLKPEIVLCGHTHGGQIRFPVFGALSTHSDASRREPSGLVYLEGCRLHISPGIGSGRIVPFRILSPPEITEIVLEKLSSAVEMSGGEDRR